MGLAQPRRAIEDKDANCKRRVICIHDTYPTKDTCFEPAPVADDYLPCIGVAANPNGVGKLCLESWESTESAGEHKVEETPQFA